VSVNESTDSLSKEAQAGLDKEKYWTSAELIQMATTQMIALEQNIPNLNETLRSLENTNDSLDLGRYSE